MSRARRETLARIAAEARDDARAETCVELGNAGARYRGHTPHTIDGRPTFAARVGGFQNRMRLGRPERKRDGGTKFSADRNAPIARAMVKATEDRRTPWILIKPSTTRAAR